jgi:hypothetical protein
VSVLVQVWLPGPTHDRAWDEEVPPPRTTVVPADQEVVLRFRKGTLREVHVVDSRGSPAGGGTVAVSWKDGTVAWYSVDAGGTARVPVPGGVELVALKAVLGTPDGATEVRTLEALPSGEGTIELRLAPGKD